MDVRNHEPAQRNTVVTRATQARGANVPVGDRRQPRIALDERPARVLSTIRNRTRAENLQTAPLGRFQHAARNQNQMRPQWR